MGILFSNQFSTSGSGQPENTQICVFAYFQFDPFPESKIDSESRFEKRMPIFLFWFFFKEFRSIFLKNQKIDFPLYIKKVIWPA